MKNAIRHACDAASEQFGIPVRRYARNSVWNTLDHVIRIATGIILSIMLARWTTKEVFGSYTLLLSVFALAGLIAAPGASTVIFRAISKGYDGTYHKGVRFIFKWSILGVPALILLGGYFYQEGSLVLALCILASAVLLPLFYTTDRWHQLLQAKEKFVLHAKYDIIATVLRLGAVAAVLILSEGDLFAIFLIYILINTAAGIYYYHATIGFISNKETEEGWKLSAYKLWLPAIFDRLFQHADKIILFFFLGVEKVAVYYIAVIIGDSLRQLMKNALSVVFPRIQRANTLRLINLTKKNALALIFCGTVITLVLMLAIPYLLPLIYSDAYAESVLPAQVYLLILPLYFFLPIGSQILIKDRQETFFTISLIASMMVSLIGYVLLIPLFGVMGAVVSSALFFVTQGAMRWTYIIAQAR